MLLKLYSRLNLIHYLNSSVIACQTGSLKACFSSEVKIPKNTMEHLICAHKQTENGVVYDKKPFKVKLEAGKKYSWCLCGKSRNQPFCDGTHRDVFLKITLRPVKFTVEETKEYWLCNCKHTNRRPFCDGMHKSKLVQESNSTVRQ